MRSSSSEDEDRPITRAFPEGPPTQTPTSKGGVNRSQMGILVAVETQMVPAEESWHHWVKDFPLWRDSIHA
jgi:hypothetical protein